MINKSYYVHQAVQELQKSVWWGEAAEKVKEKTGN